MGDNNKEPSISEESHKKRSEAAKNRPPAQDTTKKKMSESRSGEKHYLFGKHRSEERCKKISEGRIGKYCGKENPFFGKHYSPATCEKIRKNQLGKTPWNKGKKGLQPFTEATSRRLTKQAGSPPAKAG